MTDPTPPEIVVFDLGGVLVRLSGMQAFSDLTGEPDYDIIWERWLACRWVRSFERGRCGPDEFAAGVVEDWALPIAPAAFLEVFRSWPDGLEDGALALVGATRGSVTTACLSNTNRLHWENFGGPLGLADAFDHRYLSFELDLIKPDLDIFHHVAEDLGADPAGILFLDDNQANVDAATTAGWRAERVRGVPEAAAALRRHRVA